MNTELNESAEKYAEHKSSSPVFKEAHIKDFKAGAQWQAEQKQSAGDGLDLNKHLEQLFLECEHGDEQHRKWLKDKFDDYGKKYETLLENKWNDAKKDPPPTHTVVLGFNKKWVDEDYEPEGIRECFIGGEGWISAFWDNEMDTWRDDDKTEPTHWMKRPSPPINK